MVTEQDKQRKKAEEYFDIFDLNHDNYLDPSDLY